MSNLPTRVAFVAVGQTDQIARYYTQMIGALGNRAPVAGFETRTFVSSEPAVAYLAGYDGGRTLIYLSSRYQTEANRVAEGNPGIKVLIFSSVDLASGAAQVHYKNQITRENIVQIIS